MSREFPDWINPWKAAEGGRMYRGTVPLERLRRLAPLLAETTGEACFRARFWLDSQKRAMVDIEVEAGLPLVCQVSLERFRLPVQRHSSLAVVETESEQTSLPEEYEATCAHEGRLGLDELVEDELLLALPQVPRKPGLERPQAEPDEAAADDEQETYRPFAGLQKLLQGERKDR